MKIEGEFNIYRAADTKDLLLSALRDEATLVLDLSSVNEFDSAGLQLLMLARREARLAGKGLKLIAPSRYVMEVLRLCQLEGQFTVEQAEGSMETIL